VTSWWVNLTDDAWMSISAAYFVLLLVASGISVFWGKGFGEGTVGGLVAALLFSLFPLWALSAIILIFIKYLPLIIVTMSIFVVGLSLLLGFAWISGVVQRRRKRNGR
jgi:hypothetical protein